MAWPFSQDYNEAIQSPRSNFADPELAAGEAATNALGLPQPRSGNFADVYEVRCPGGARWAVKCFTREVAGLRERYHEISRHLSQANLPFTVDFSYLEKGIRVHGQWYPVLKMQWVEGLTLNDFVRQYLDKPAMLDALATIWTRMARRLRETRIGHCDLQHGNVLLVPGREASSLAVKLIDYDGMHVPALAGKKSGEVGHAAYQHPQRIREGTYSIEVDRFPLLLIAAALRSVAVGGRPLWERYDNGDNMLFREADLKAPAASALFRELGGLNDPQARLLIGHLWRASQVRLEETPLLEQLLPDDKPAPVPAPRPVPPRPAPPARVTNVTLVPAEQKANPNFDFEEDSLRRRRRKGKAPLVAAGILGGLVAIAAVSGAIAWALHGDGDKEKGGDGGPVAQGPADGGTRDDQKTPSNKDGSTEPGTGAEGQSDPPNGKPPIPIAVEQQLRIVNASDPRPGGPGQPVSTNPNFFRPARTCLGHEGAVLSVGVSADGKRAVTTGMDRTVYVWDLDVGKEVWTKVYAANPPRVAALLPNGKRFVIGWKNGDLNAAGVPGPEAPPGWLQEKRHPAAVTALTLSVDGNRILTCGEDGSACFGRLDPADRGESAWMPHASQVLSAGLTPDGTKALTCGEDGTARIWDLAKREERVRFQGQNKTGKVTAAVLSPDGRRVLVCYELGLARVFDLADQNEVLRLDGLGPAMHSAAWSPDGKYFVTAGGSSGVASSAKRLCVWDAASGQLRKLFNDRTCHPRALAFSGDSKRFVSADSDGTVQVWQVIGPVETAPPMVVAKPPKVSISSPRTLAQNVGSVRAISTSPNGKALLSGTTNGRLCLWDLADLGKEPRTIVTHGGAVISDVAWTPDGKKALYGSLDKTVRFVDVDAGKDLFTFTGHEGPVFFVAVSPDGSLGLSGGGDKTVRVWDLKTGKERRVLTGHGSNVTGVRFLPDGKRALSCSADTTLRLWDVESGTQLRIFPGSTASLTILALSPDGRLALTGNNARSIDVWDVQAGKHLGRVSVPSFVEGLAFTPDGRYFVCATGRAETAQMECFDAATRESVGKSSGADYFGRSLAFTPDGRQLVAASFPLSLRTWQVKGAEVAPPPSLPPVLAATGRELPSGDALAEAENKVKEAHKAALDKATTAPAQRELAKALFEEGQKTKDDRALRYVLFREARDLAARATDPAFSLKVIDESAKDFNFDVLEAKGKAMQAASEKCPGNRDGTRGFIDALLPLLDEAEAVDRYEVLDKAIQGAVALCRNNYPTRTPEVEAKVARFKHLQTNYAALKDAPKVLQADPKDAKANLAVGRFRCFDKQEWNVGLPLLAQGGDDPLALLARKDLENPAEAKDRLALGKGWREQLNKAKEPARSQGLRRAFHWDWQALSLPGIDDESRATAEQQMWDLIKEVPDVWEHLDLAGAKPQEGFVRLVPDQKITTRGRHDVPLEGHVEVRATDKPAVSLKVYQGDTLLFTVALAPNKALTIYPSDNRLGRPQDKEVLKVGAIKPKEWHVVRWRLIDDSIEVTLNGVPIAKERALLALLRNGPMSVKASEVSADVRGFAVRALKK